MNKFKDSHAVKEIVSPTFPPKLFVTMSIDTSLSTHKKRLDTVHTMVYFDKTFINKEKRSALRVLLGPLGTDLSLNSLLEII